MVIGHTLTPIVSTVMLSSGIQQRPDAARIVELRNEGRTIMSREKETYVSIKKILMPGKKTKACFVCCNAPSCCAICSTCPCCDNSESLVLKLESSKYFHIRENSIEWNEPEIVMREGPCLGIDPCIFDVQDHVRVVYFDDPLFGQIKNTTRSCNEFLSCLCGGRGESLRISATCCFGTGYRGPCPCLCIPICCPLGETFLRGDHLCF